MVKRSDITDPIDQAVEYATESLRRNLRNWEDNWERFVVEHKRTFLDREAHWKNQIANLEQINDKIHAKMKLLEGELLASKSKPTKPAVKAPKPKSQPSLKVLAKRVLKKQRRA